MSNILITEKQLEELVKTIKESSEEELEEGFLGDLGRDIGTLRFGNIFAGLKGAFTGKGYSLSRNMNIIKNSLKRLKSSEKIMLSVMKELKHVEVEFSEIETTNDIVLDIISNLRSVVSHYDGYKHASRNLQNIVNTYYQSQKKDKDGKGGGSSSGSIVNPKPKTPTSTSYTPPITTNTQQPVTTSSTTSSSTSNKVDSLTQKEDYFKVWISGEYKIPNENNIYYLTATKKWEVRKPGGTFEPLKSVLSKDEYEKKLESLKTSLQA